MAKATKVVTGKVRFSYAHVFQPQASQDGGTPKYSVSLDRKSTRLNSSH